MKIPQEIRSIIRETLDVYLEPLETETWYKNNREQLISDLVNCFVENKAMQEYAEQEAKEDAMKFAEWIYVMGFKRYFRVRDGHNGGEDLWIRINIEPGVRLTSQELYDKYEQETKTKNTQK